MKIKKKVGAFNSFTECATCSSSVGYRVYNLNPYFDLENKFRLPTDLFIYLFAQNCALKEMEHWIRHTENHKPLDRKKERNLKGSI